MHEHRESDPGRTKAFGPAGKREIFSWAMFDFANSSYTTVVLTAVFNAYFVGVIAGGNAASSRGSATLAWTTVLALSNFLVLLSAPFIGALADHLACKKRFLLWSTAGCVLSTAALSLVGPGDLFAAAVFLVCSSFLFATGEDLIAAFLPEISTPEHMGRISGYGWSLGYIGGLSVLALCLLYIHAAEAAGAGPEQFVPLSMLIVAGSYALGSIPTFMWHRERAVAGDAAGRPSWIEAFRRVRNTLVEARRFEDLFRLLLCIAVYTCGINTVVVLAAIYAQEVIGMTSTEIVSLILVLNLAAAVGAFAFGHAQDRFGSVPTLGFTLLLWILASGFGVFAEDKSDIWIVGNLIGIAMGASQSAGRGLVGQFTPPGRSAEFFGLWGLAVKLSAIVGPMTYGLLSYGSGGNHRLALLSTVVFFIAGLGLLHGVDEQRGREAALLAAADGV